MEASTLIQVVIIAACVAAVAFFSSSEVSLIAVNKARVRHLAAQGSGAAAAVNRVVGQHEKFFAAILLTENALIILASIVAADLFGKGPYAQAIATVVMTAAIVSVGEITPKSLAARVPEPWSMVVARPIGVIMWLETYIIYLFTLLPRGLSRLFWGEARLQAPTVTEGELRMLIDLSHAEGEVDKHEASMLENVFRFGDLRVQQVMTPRMEIVWVPVGTPLEEFMAIYAEHYHTRFPVYEGETDNVVGILSAKDVLRAYARGEMAMGSPVTAALRPVHFVPETKPVGSLFSEMRKQRHQMAMVADEFGGVAGLVTMKQLLEVIVGRMEEPEEEPAVEAQDERTLHLDGGTTVEQVNAEAGLELPRGDYQTVAGFLLSVLGHIPREGEVVRLPRHLVVVEKMSGVRISRVRVTMLAGTEGRPP